MFRLVKSTLVLTFKKPTGALSEKKLDLQIYSHTSGINKIIDNSN